MSKYFQQLPDQVYTYKRFDAVDKMHGCECDECGAWLQNIVTVTGSVDHIDYHLGLTCCEKASKGMKNISLDDKTTQAIKFWKKKLTKLKNFRKKFDNDFKDSIAVLGEFTLSKKKTTSIDFTFLYEGGNWIKMHEDFCITGFYDKVKETFKDVWSKVDWGDFKTCAEVNDSKEVFKILPSLKVDFNERTKIHYPEWERECEVRNAIRVSFDYNNGWGEGKIVKLPIWFNKEEYNDIFDKVVKLYGGYQDLEKTTFVNCFKGD